MAVARMWRASGPEVRGVGAANIKVDERYEAACNVAVSNGRGVYVASTRVRSPRCERGEHHRRRETWRERKGNEAEQ